MTYLFFYTVQLPEYTTKVAQLKWRKALSTFHYPGNLVFAPSLSVVLLTHLPSTPFFITRD